MAALFLLYRTTENGRSAFREQSALVIAPDEAAARQVASRLTNGRQGFGALDYGVLKVADEASTDFTTATRNADGVHFLGDAIGVAGGPLPPGL